MTIYALSTVEGQSGVAIIRVSGPLSKKVINTLTGKEPKPRLATLVKIKTLKNKTNRLEELFMRLVDKNGK